MQELHLFLLKLESHKDLQENLKRSQEEIKYRNDARLLANW